MGKITYYLGLDRSRLYLNIVDKYKCSNKCEFCDKELLEEVIGNELFLDKKPSLKDITDAIDKEMKNNKPKWIVFCGIGESTIYFKELIGAISYIKQNYDVPIRLNTNGHANLLHKGIDAAKALKDAGLDMVSISLNSTTKEEYNKIHNPCDKENAFDAVLNFIKDSKEYGLNLHVSFVEVPELDKNKAMKFAKSLGLDEKNVRFRLFISKN